MTRAQIIQSVTSMLKSLPKTAHLDVEMRAGSATQGMNTGIVERRPNGTMTITIRVNGGATDYELEPEFFQTARELSREH